jgi:ferredoxin
MPAVRFFREGITLSVPDGANLRDVALQAGVQLYRSFHVWSNCKGRGKCGSCRVEVSEPDAVLPEQRTDAEQRFLDRKFSDRTTRLSCQVCVRGDVSVLTQDRRGKHVEARSFIPRGF